MDRRTDYPVSILLNSLSFLRKKAVLPYLFIAPVFIFIAVFLFYPMGNVFYFSFQHYNVAKPYTNGFAGFENFIRIFSDDRVFYKTLLVTLKWVFFTVSIQLIAGLIVALVLNQQFRGRGFFRAIIFIPWAVSGILTSLLWSMMFNEHMGVINALLLKMGIINDNIAWIANMNTVFGSIVTAEIWRGLPFFVIILLAALQVIPTEIYDSCKVDGTGRLGAFYYVTFPYLKDTIIFATLLRTIWEFNNIDVIYAITGGGPANMTTTLAMYIINQAIKASNFGYGSALTVVAFLILVAFIVLYLKLTGYGSEELK